MIEKALSMTTQQEPVTQADEETQGSSEARVSGALWDAVWLKMLGLSAGAEDDEADGELPLGTAALKILTQQGQLILKEPDVAKAAELSDAAGVDARQLVLMQLAAGAVSVADDSQLDQSLQIPEDSTAAEPEGEASEESEAAGSAGAEGQLPPAESAAGEALYPAEHLIQMIADAQKQAADISHAQSAEEVGEETLPEPSEQGAGESAKEADREHKPTAGHIRPSEAAQMLLRAARTAASEKGDAEAELSQSPAGKQPDDLAVRGVRVTDSDGSAEKVVEPEQLLDGAGVQGAGDKAEPEAPSEREQLLRLGQSGLASEEDVKTAAAGNDAARAAPDNADSALGRLPQTNLVSDLPRETQRSVDPRSGSSVQLRLSDSESGSLTLRLNSSGQQLTGLLRTADSQLFGQLAGRMPEMRRDLSSLGYQEVDFHLQGDGSATGQQHQSGWTSQQQQPLRQVEARAPVSEAPTGGIRGVTGAADDRLNLLV